MKHKTLVTRFEKQRDALIEKFETQFQKRAQLLFERINKTDMPIEMILIGMGTWSVRCKDRNKEIQYRDLVNYDSVDIYDENDVKETLWITDEQKELFNLLDYCEDNRIALSHLGVE